MPSPGRSSCTIRDSPFGDPLSRPRRSSVHPVPRRSPSLPERPHGHRDPVRPTGIHPRRRHALSKLSTHRAARALVRLSGLLRTARGGVRLRAGRTDPDPRGDRGSGARDLALSRTAPRGRATGPRPSGRLHAPARRRPAGSGPRPGPALDQGRHPQSDPQLQGSGRRGRGSQGRRIRRGGPRLRLDREPRRRDGCRSGHPGPAGLRVHPGRSRAGQGGPRAGLRRDRRPDRGDLRRRQPAVPRSGRRDRLGLRQHQPPAVLRRGLQDARVRDRRDRSAGAPPT